MQIDLWQLIGVTGGWSATLMTLAVSLHRIRRSQFDKLIERIERAETKAAKEHAALVVQVADINQTTAEHYVRKEDLQHDLRDIKDAIDSNTKAVSTIGARVDKLYQDVAWRKGA